VTETALIYLLTALTLARLICHIRPSFLASLDRIARAKLLEGVDSVVWAGVVALFLIHFVVRSFYIPSGSMLPTLHINDFILVNEMIYEFSDPVRGDIVVFHPPSDPYAAPQSIDKTDLIKRVVGLAHDSIEVKDGVLYLNGQALDEPYIKEPIFKNYGPTRVEEGEIFVMGDNRNDSKDSRYIGAIPLENLVGRAEIIFYPFNRIRVFNFPQ
jgi:signal peptidase I